MTTSYPTQSLGQLQPERLNTLKSSSSCLPFSNCTTIIAGLGMCSVHSFFQQHFWGENNHIKVFQHASRRSQSGSLASCSHRTSKHSHFCRQEQHADRFLHYCTQLWHLTPGHALLFTQCNHYVLLLFLKHALPWLCCTLHDYINCLHVWVHAVQPIIVRSHARRKRRTVLYFP